MPNCFQLYPIGSREPAILQKVDEEICDHFNVPVHPTQWVHGWYNVIGFLIAIKGHDLGSRELRIDVAKWYDSTSAYYQIEGKRHAWDMLHGQMLILNYLEKHYTSTGWVEIGKR